MGIKAGNIVVKAEQKPDEAAVDNVMYKVGKLVVANKPIEPKVVEKREPVKKNKKEDALISRFYKESPYTQHMINS